MQNKTFRIHRIDREQITLIADLWGELKVHQQTKTLSFTDYYRSVSFGDRRTELLAKDMLGIFVAESDNDRVGFCVASVTSAVGNIDSLYTRPPYRGRSIGSQLL